MQEMGDGILPFTVIWEEWVLLLGCTVHGVKFSPGIGDMTD
jgi:hypothetical protein